MLRKFKIPFIVLITVLLNQAAGYAVHAAMPDSFRPSGTTCVCGGIGFRSDQCRRRRYVREYARYVDVHRHPGRQTRDIMILFCGDVLRL